MWGQNQASGQVVFRLPDECRDKRSISKGSLRGTGFQCALKLLRPVQIDKLYWSGIDMTVYCNHVVKGVGSASGSEQVRLMH